jgi:hypothetical protein
MQSLSTPVKTQHPSFVRNARPVTYSRTQDLPRLLPLWPHETIVVSPGDQSSLVARLRRALRAERRRGIAGHWTYNLARHADLLRAYRAELECVKAQPKRRTGHELAQLSRRPGPIDCNVQLHLQRH